MSKIRQSSIKWVPFGSVVLFSQYGLSGATQNKGKYPVLRMGNLIGGKISTENLVYIDLPTDYFNKFKLKKSDLLVNRTNSVDLVGKTALFELDDNFVCASYLIRFVLNKKIVEPRFISYFFNTESSKAYLKALSTKGVSQSNINPTVLKKNFKVPLLSLSEQKKIVEVLSTWDQAIEKLDKLILAKEKEFRWLLKKLITDQKNNPKWKEVRIGKVCDIFNGSTPSRDNKLFWNNGTIPWFTVEDIRVQGRKIFKTEQKITKTALQKTSVTLLPEKTVLLCCTASVGEYAFAGIKLTTNQQFNGLVINNAYKKLLVPEFLFQLTSTFKDKLLSVSGKTSFNFVSVKKLKNFEISFPSLSEQNRVVKILSKWEQEVEILKQFSSKYQEQKKGLMQQLLTGKWRIEV